MQVTREWLNGSSKIYAVQVTADDGKRFDVNLDRGWISWADLAVWEEPAKYGLSRYTCPGHNGQVCFYGMCDEIRVADTSWLAGLGYTVQAGR